MKSIPLKKTGIVAGLILLSLIVLTVIFVALLPMIVSSESVRKTIEETASSTLGTEFHIGELSWSWREGIVLKQIRVNDHPDFSDKEMLSLDQLHVQLFFRDLFKKRVHAELLVSGLAVNLIKNQSGLLNISRLCSGKPEAPGALPKEEIKPPPEKKSVLPIIALPVDDVSLNVTLKEFQAHYTDLGTQKNFSLENLELKLDIPSLVETPSKLLLSTDISINGNPFPNQKLGLILYPPRLTGREMDLKEMAIELEGLFPGITLTGTGSPLKEGFKGDIKVDFPMVRTLAAPFLPPDLSNLEVSGSLAFQYDIKTDPSFETLTFDTTLWIKEATVKGGPVPGGPLGPVSVTLKNQGAYLVKEGNLSLKSGNLELLSNTKLSYSLEAIDVTDGDPLIDFKIEPLHVDLKELYDFIGPVLPENLKKNPPVSFDALSLEIAKITFRGKLKETPEIAIDTLRLSTPAIQGNDPSAPFSAGDLSVSIPRLAVTLKEMFPETAALSLGISFSNLNLLKEPLVTVKDFSLSDLDISATQLKPSKTSPLGITGELHVKNRLSVESIDVPKTASLTDFSQSADFLCQISENPLIRIGVTEFTGAIERFKADTPEPDTITTGVNFSFSTPEMTIPQMAPFQMDIAKADMKLALDDALTLTVQADALDLAKTHLETNGKLVLDLEKMSKKINPAFLKGILLSGKTSLDWGLSGKLFTDEELKKIIATPHALKENLSFIDQATVSLSLAEMGVDMTIPENQKVKIRSIETSEPLLYAYNGKTGAGHLSGKLLLKDILSLPGDPFKKPLSLTLGINGKNQGTESISLAQDLVITPLNIRETFTLDLMGADKLLASGLHTPLADILTYLDGVMALSITSSGKEDFSAVKSIPDLSGEASFGLAARLIPKEKASLGLFATLVDVNAKDPGFFTLENANASIRFDKTWGILWEKKDPAALKKHLSVQVLDSGTDALSRNRAASEKMAAFLDSMKTRLNPERSLSLSRFQMTGGAFPLSASDMELDLSFNDGLPVIPYLKIDLFGGTLITAASISQKAKDAYLNLNLAFSGIDTRKVFLEKTGQKENLDMEISGKMAVNLPLSPNMTDLIAGLKVDIFFSHIGKKALEKMLYTLDPSESNEQIVAQRKLLRKGTPRWIRLLIEDGALSLSGKVLIFNMEEDIPPIQRLNISNLSILKEHERDLHGISSVIDILSRLSASHIDITRKEDVQFLR